MAMLNNQMVKENQKNCVSLHTYSHGQQLADGCTRK